MEVLPLRDYLSHVHPQEVVLGGPSGVYRLIWDNSSSWMTPLRLWTSLTVRDLAPTVAGGKTRSLGVGRAGQVGRVGSVGSVGS